MLRLKLFAGGLIAVLALGGLVPARLARGQDLPVEAYVTGFVGYPQQRNLSCESRSSADWANFFGASTSEAEILARLAITDNPETGFVGDVDGQWGAIPPYAYGVHPPPLVTVLRELGLPAAARSGMSWDEARREIAANRPVIIWVIGAMWAGTPVDYTDSAGQTTVVAHFEHSMVLTGYSASSVQAVDATSGLAQWYSLASFLNSWSVLGNRAIVYDAGSVQPTPTSTLATATPTPAPDPPGRVVVRAGDSLLGLADRYDLHWQELAKINHLTFPYFLYPSQTLRLPTPQPGADVAPLAGTPQSTPTPAPSATAIPATPAEVPANVYQVEKGDYLAAVGARLGIDWRLIAGLNNIAYPYTIYAGQKLVLP
jgi:LysM repeat protein